MRTWQDGEKDDNDGVEEQDVGNRNPNGQPAPPVVNRHANGLQDAVTQGLSCSSIRVQLVLPVTCNKGHH